MKAAVLIRWDLLWIYFQALRGDAVAQEVDGCLCKLTFLVLSQSLQNQMDVLPVLSQGGSVDQDATR